MLHLIAKRPITLHTDNGQVKLVQRQRLNILSSESVEMFGQNYIQMTFKKGATLHTFKTLATSFSTQFA